MIRRSFCIACYHVWLRLPLSWHGRWLSNWLLPYAGEYAFGVSDAP